MTVTAIPEVSTAHVGVGVSVAGVAISGVTITAIVGIGVSLSVGGPLAKTLGRSGNVAGGITGVGSDAGSSVVVAEGSIAVVGLGISGPLASQALGRSGDKAGGGSGVSSNAGSSVVVAVAVCGVGSGGIAVAVVGVSIGVGGPLAATPKTGGGVVGGGNSGPVGVGVVQGGNTVVGLSLGGAHGDGQSGTSNLKKIGNILRFVFSDSFKDMKISQQRQFQDLCMV
ncbi:MAG: hypothetical protein GY696_37420 [Gammaproteobacteria bacterium]|nr:hypothetical protein [Gammaproteobacteria bacterium]